MAQICMRTMVPQDPMTTLHPDTNIGHSAKRISSSPSRLCLVHDSSDLASVESAPRVSADGMAVPSSVFGQTADAARRVARCYKMALGVAVTSWLWKEFTFQLSGEGFNASR
ncbi:hypothetical protein GGTG_02217 [Gaeumannomyces tritici R3-111a-1]|uniref:Uncharacterized protein n=1 Tax=Gaeumannomyces tritici (strain R3-111a-1) TaxID=644352 RepID=J3NLR7_GAET3|nr:hypothetical protein GGTG_02217 [Gaeumannomyces tritici R3-111a-1]EJT82243.1 hypothetical protein GGTG_02217 [Gaeumannomyces tritici R3-111a-1]